MWRRVLYVVAPVMVLAIGLVAALAVNQRLDIQTANNAIARRDNTVTELDEEANTQRTDQPILSMRLGLAADALKDSPTTRSALISTLTSGLPHNTLLSGQGTVRSAAFGPNGLVMTADEAGTILWNITQLSAPILVAHLETQSTQTAAMSANGQVVITSPVDSDELEFWDTTRPAFPHLLTSIRTNCQPVSISVASSLPIALSGCANGTATLWDLRVTNDPRNSGNLAPPPTGLHSVALASDGTAAMVASDHGLSTWSIDPALGSHLDTPDYTQVNNEASNGTIRPAYSVAVDPSGQIAVVGQDDMAAELAHSVEAENRPVPAATLDLHNGGGDVLASGVDNQADRVITASPGNTATVWQLHDENGISTYTPMAELGQHSDVVTSAAISPDGRVAITGGRDGTAVIWDLSNQQPYGLDNVIYGAFSANVADVSCAHRSTVCVTVTADGTATVWEMADPTEPRPVGNLNFDGDYVRSVVFAPNSATLAAATTYGTTLWDLSMVDQPILLSRLASDHGTNAVAFTPNGRVVVAGGDQGHVTVWDIEDLDRPRRLGQVPGTRPSIRTLSVDDTGAILAVGAADGTVQLADIGDPSHPRLGASLARQPGSVLNLAFSPSGPTLLQVNDGAQPPVVWDVSTTAVPRLIAKLVGHTGAVNSVAYNDNGTMAVTVSQDDTAIVWNMDDPAEPTPMATLTGHTGQVLSASFSADGSTVITGSSDESVITWNVSQLVTITDDPRRAACTLAGPFDRQGWRSWVSKTIPYLDNC